MRGFIVLILMGIFAGCSVGPECSISFNEVGSSCACSSSTNPNNVACSEDTVTVGDSSVCCATSNWPSEGSECHCSPVATKIRCNYVQISPYGVCSCQAIDSLRDFRFDAEVESCPAPPDGTTIHCCEKANSCRCDVLSCDKEQGQREVSNCQEKAIAPDPNVCLSNWRGFPQRVKTCSIPSMNPNNSTGGTVTPPPKPKPMCTSNSDCVGCSRCSDGTCRACIIGPRGVCTC